ncbi:MAG: copper chaperone PCu(A)C [Proteobacteria bacterium]|nr:copper chaperone PCu(A)C [Pseudomonadota bacterium]
MTHTPAITVLACLLASCSASHAPLVASDVLVSRPVPGTQISAAYLSLTNTSRQKITITKITSPNFESAELHESVLDDGIARMVALGELTIMPQQTVLLEPGGLHLMLMRPVGAIETVTLNFYAGEALLLSVDTVVKGLR